jgi:hypothetical protein
MRRVTRGTFASSAASLSSASFFRGSPASAARASAARYAASALASLLVAVGQRELRAHLGRLELHDPGELGASLVVGVPILCLAGLCEELHGERVVVRLLRSRRPRAESGGGQQRERSPGGVVP